GGKMQATAATSTLEVGSYDVTATYNGDGNFLGGDANALKQAVDPAQTATALKASPNPSSFGQEVTFTATVTVKSPGAGTPLGTVTFQDGGTAQSGGTVALALVNGVPTAQFKKSALAVGTHPITAVYTDTVDGHFATSTSSKVDQQVTAIT